MKKLSLWPYVLICVGAFGIWYGGFKVKITPLAEPEPSRSEFDVGNAELTWDELHAPLTEGEFHGYCTPLRLHTAEFKRAGEGMTGVCTLRWHRFDDTVRVSFEFGGSQDPAEASRAFSWDKPTITRIDTKPAKVNNRLLDTLQYLVVDVDRIAEFQMLYDSEDGFEAINLTPNWSWPLIVSSSGTVRVDGSRLSLEWVEDGRDLWKASIQ